MTSATPRIPCLICHGPLTLRLARGRKSGKPFIMLICPQDGRHLRAFITDKEYVAGVLKKLEGQTGVSGGGDDDDNASSGGRRSTPVLSDVEGTNFELGGTP